MGRTCGPAAAAAGACEEGKPPPSMARVKTLFTTIIIAGIEGGMTYSVAGPAAAAAAAAALLLLPLARLARKEVWRASALGWVVDWRW